MEFKKPVAVLASGVAKVNVNQWHRLEMRFKGSRILAFLDGAPLASVESSAHLHGMVGLSTEWDHVQFDNLRVTPD